MTDEVVDVVGGLRVKHLLHRGLLAVALGLHLLLGLDLDLDGSVDLGLSGAFCLLNLERVALREQPLLNLDELLGLTRACTCRTGDPECAWRRRRTSWSSIGAVVALHPATRGVVSCSETMETESQQSPERLGAPLAAGRLRRDPDAVVCDASVWFMPRRELMMFVCSCVDARLQVDAQ